VALALPERRLTGQALPLLIFCHGGGGGASWGGAVAGSVGATVDGALSLGMAVASSNMHGDSHGNAQQQTDIADLFAWVRSQVDISQVVFLGQSLGGLSSLNAITQGTLTASGIRVAGAGLIYPVIDMRAYPGGGSGTQTIAAYGLTNGTLSASASIGATSISSSVSYPSGTILQLDVSNGANYELVTVTGSPSGAGPYTIPVTALTKAHASGVIVSDYGTKVEAAGYNPATRLAAAFGNKRYRTWASLGDTVVDLTNNVLPFNSKISATARESSLAYTRGNHGDVSNFDYRDQCQFLLRCINDTAIT